MDLLLCGINILALLVLWHFVVKKTLVDHARDKLFDLRDQIRREHISRGWGIDSEAYKNLRKMINAYLRYTESYSVWKIVALHVELSQNEEMREHVRKRVSSNFETNSPEHASYIKTVRSAAFDAISEFSMTSSGLLIVISLICMPVFMFHRLLTMFNKGLRVAMGLVAHDLRHFASTIRKTWKKSTKLIGSKLIDMTAFDIVVANEHHKFT